MDWSPVLTVVATGLVTLGGVWLNGRVSQRRDEQKLRAEEVREVDRTRREDEAQARIVREAVSATARGLAATIAGLFLDELQAVRQYSEAANGKFTTWFDERWKTTGDIALRRSIGGVMDSGDRTRLIQMLDALDEYEGLTIWDFSQEPVKVEELLSLAFDLSATMARGQEPDAELTARFEKFQKDVNGHDAYQEAQRLAQHEAWKVDLEERKKKKAEEAAQTAAGWPSEETPF